MGTGTTQRRQLSPRWRQGSGSGGDTNYMLLHDSNATTILSRLKGVLLDFLILIVYFYSTDNKKDTKTDRLGVH